MNDKLLAKDRKGYPADLRGLMLLGTLTGSARKLALKVPQDVVESEDGVEAILTAVVITDPISEAQDLQVAHERLDATAKNVKEPFSNFVQRYRSNWADLERLIDGPIPTAVMEQNAFKMLKGSGLQGSEKAQALSSAIRANAGNVNVIDSSSHIRSSLSSKLSTLVPKFQQEMANNKERSRTLKEKIGSLQNAYTVQGSDLNACKDRLAGALTTIDALNISDETKNVFHDAMESMEKVINAVHVMSADIVFLVKNSTTLFDGSTKVMEDFNELVPHMSPSSGSVQDTRNPVITIDSVASSLLTLDVADFGSKKKKSFDPQYAQSLLSELRKYNSTKDCKLRNNKNGTKAPGKRRIDKSKDKCHTCGEVGHWTGDRICKMYDPSKRGAQKGVKVRFKQEEPERMSEDSESDSDIEKN